MRINKCNYYYFIFVIHSFKVLPPLFYSNSKMQLFNTMPIIITVFSNALLNPASVVSLTFIILMYANNSTFLNQMNNLVKRACERHETKSISTLQFTGCSLKLDHPYNNYSTGEFHQFLYFNPGGIYFGQAVNICLHKLYKANEIIYVRF